MSLSEYIQVQEIFSLVKNGNPAELKTMVQDRVAEWFDAHPEDGAAFKQNFTVMGIQLSLQQEREFIHQLALHYYEKLLPLCLSPTDYAAYLQSNVDMGDFAGRVLGWMNEGKGVLCASMHFGAVELSVPSLSLQGIPVVPVLRFRSQQLSEAARVRAAEMEATGLFGHIDFVEIGKPDTVAALDMAAVLRRKHALFTMVDEETGYSKPVSLFGKQIKGGAGIDKLLLFCRCPVAVVQVFMLRTGEDKYRLVAHECDATAGDLIQSMYVNLEPLVRANPQQWYFAHEEIPFVG